MPLLTLQIVANKPAPGWIGQWHADARPVGDPIRVADQAAASIADLSRRFRSLFEQGERPLAPPEYLRAMGRELFATWFEPVWPSIKPTLGVSAPRHLLIQSTDQTALNLPWELVELEGDRPVGCDAAWSLCRSPIMDRAEVTGSLRAGPLRILFLTSAPIDQAQLDYEREEDAMLRAIARLQNVSVHFAESGSFEELKELVAECRPHVVHLSGHGTVDDSGMGSFAFENERGRTFSVDAATIVSDVFRGSHHGVRCVFFNGCSTSKAATAGICQSLVIAGMPIAIGWAEMVADDRATDFVEEFYHGLLRKEPVPVASAHARELIRREGLIAQGPEPKQDATFALPQVYARAADGFLFDPKLPSEPHDGPSTYYGPIDSAIAGLREDFIGRRRELQRLIPTLREGEKTFAVITGLGGTGKSTLATRVANRLNSAGFQVIAVRARKDPRGIAESGSALTTRLMEAIDDEFLRRTRKDLSSQVTDASLTLSQRIRLAIKGLNELRVVVVIDNFEDVIDLETRKILDPDLAYFYEKLSTGLTQVARVIVTCRYLPASTPIDLPTLMHLPLGEFTEPDFRKFLRSNNVVEARIAIGELRGELLHSLYESAGGTPGFLKTVRELLREIDPDELRDDLEGVSHGALSAARESYHQRIDGTRLYDALTPEARDIASRLALSELPLPRDGVAAIVAFEANDLEPALNACLAFGLLQRLDEPDLPSLYQAPGILRPWLSHPDRLAETDAHEVNRRLAGFWLSCFEKKRAEELRVNSDAVLWGCRAHAERGEDFAIFRMATVRLSSAMRRRGEWMLARALLYEVPDDKHDAESVLVLSDLEIALGESDAARDLLERVLESPGNDRTAEGSARYQLATIELNRGNYELARREFGLALEIVQAVGHRVAEAATLRQIATIDIREGSYAAARQNLAHSLKIDREIGDREGEATSWHDFAMIDVQLGAYSAGREKLDRSFAMKEEICDQTGKAVTLHGLAVIDIYEGKYPDARDRLECSLSINRMLGNRTGEAANLQVLASIDSRQVENKAARKTQERSLKIREELGDRLGQAECWHQLASIELYEGNYEAGREKYQQSLEISLAIGYRAGEAKTRQQLGSIDVAQGSYAAALENFVKALEIDQASGDRVGEAVLFFHLGDLAQKIGRGDDGARLIAICALLNTGIGHPSARQDFIDLGVYCQRLGYSQDQYDETITNANEDYEKDRCKSLIERAFANLNR